MHHLRKATAQDSPAIRALIYRVGINPFSLDWRRFLVAVDEEDRLIGSGQIKPHGDGTRELASIAVQPAWQGQGIGREIIERLMAENALPLYLTCRARMSPYYEKFGFRVLRVEEMPPYFRRLYRAASFLNRLARRAGELRVMGKMA